MAGGLCAAVCCCGCHHSFDAINWESNKIILPRPGPAQPSLTMEITEVTLTQHLVQHSTWVMCPHYEETGKRRVNLDMVPCWELDFSILKLSVKLNYYDIMKKETCPFIYWNIWMMSEQITQILRRQWNLSCFCCFLEKSSIVGCLSFSQFGLKYSALDTDSILNVKWCNS